VKEDENFGTHARLASSAKASTSLMPLFFFFTQFSRFIILKNAQKGMERTEAREREKCELRKIDRQAHASKCLIKRSEAVLETYRQAQKNRRVKEEEEEELLQKKEEYE
jgi:hypothetical protein